MIYLGKKILFVDDERQILKAINRMFIGSDYEIYFAESGQEALDFLKSQLVDMVVSDMRMPQMDGLQLLTQVKSLYPSIIRIVLSGFSDEDKIYKAIHCSIVKLYLFKPWKGDDLKNTINEIFNTQEILSSKHILTMINSIEQLPVLPNMYTKLITAIEQDNNVDHIAKLVEEDQSISMQLLHIVNSAFYGIKTGSIKTAIMNIGLGNIKNLILTSKLFTISRISDADKDILWRHSSMTNKLVMLIYKSLLNKNISDSYLSAGLLHDIGRLVLLENYPKEYKKVIELITNNKDISINEAEKEVLNITHDEVGAYLLNWWEIPDPIVASSLYHNNPSLCSGINKEIVSIVHIADYYSWKTLSPNYQAKLDTNVFEYIGFSKEQFEDLIKNSYDEVD